MDYLLPQSITELGNCLMQLAATLIFVSIVQPIFLAGLPSSTPTLLSTQLHICCYFRPAWSRLLLSLLLV